MDDKILRNLSSNVLEQVKKELNPDFIKELPCSVDELFQYAKRRVDPVISSNISFPLGQSMLSHRLSDKDYFLCFLKIVHTSFQGKKKSDNKIASIMVAQTGAGKTNLRTLILKNEDSVIINPDLYKKFRSDVNQIMEEDPTHFGALTGIDSYDHSNNIRDLAAEKGYNLLFECAPSEELGLIGIDLEELKKYNYSINSKILAVGDLISSIAIHDRYEETPENPNVKLTDIRRHDESYRATAGVINELSNYNVQIFKRGTEEENFVPQELTDSSHTYSLNEFLKILNDEREKSNYEYVFENNGRSFQEDYNRIKASMIKRGAPECQIEQITEIYNKYVIYLNYIKYKDEIGNSIDDM